MSKRYRETLRRAVSRAKDLFEILGIGPPRYTIDTKDLEQAYKRIQFELHPDRFSTASEKDRQMSEAVSSLVNIAYSTLRSPLQRAQYLLRIKGVETADEVTTMLRKTSLLV